MMHSAPFVYGMCQVLMCHTYVSVARVSCKLASCVKGVAEGGQGITRTRWATGEEHAVAGGTSSDRL